MCTLGPDLCWTNHLHLDGIHQSIGLNVQSFVSRKWFKMVSVSLDPLISNFDIMVPYFFQVFDCGDEVEVTPSAAKHADRQPPSGLPDCRIGITDRLNKSDCQVA
jgi:hypothetical protein